MGDFGPAYFARDVRPGAQSIYRCDDCGVQLPLTASDGACRFCGGTLRPVGAGGGGFGMGSGPAGVNAAAAEAGLEGLATQVLQQIVPTALLEELALPQTKPADEAAVAELPLVKIEPHIQISVTRAPAPSRDLIAAAAERRRDAANVKDGAAPMATDSGSTDAAAEGPPKAGAATAAERAALEFRGTGSTFGKLLAEMEQGVSAPLVMADPADGNAEVLANAEALSGAVALMWRGGCSFVDKVRRAQKAGAVAVIVVQTLEKWPFSMSDT